METRVRERNEERQIEAGVLIQRANDKTTNRAAIH